MTSDTPNSSGSDISSAAQTTGSENPPVQPAAATEGANALQIAHAPIRESKLGNQRPVDVTRLLYNSEVHPAWDLANRQKVRFFVLNLERVLNSLNLPHTSAHQHFREAEALIASQTSWRAQHAFDYSSSHTQIYPENMRRPKLFGHAATIIVAMEIAARALQPTLNVYDHLRILAATYYIDGFDENRLRALNTYHASIPSEERAARFGAEFADRPFIDACCQRIDQTRPQVIEQVANGYCVTKHTAEKLRVFINENYPTDLRVGSVMMSGDDPEAKLGRKNAAPDLRVPRRVDEELAPCL